MNRLVLVPECVVSPPPPPRSPKASPTTKPQGKLTDYHPPPIQQITASRQRCRSALHSHNHHAALHPEPTLTTAAKPNIHNPITAPALRATAVGPAHHHHTAQPSIIAAQAESPGAFRSAAAPTTTAAAAAAVLTIAVEPKDTTNQGASPRFWVGE